MNTDLIQTLTATFEANAQQTETGVEYWLARDLQHLLGYHEWRNFTMVIAKARTACEVSGHRIADHFVDANKMVELGSGSTRQVEDILLTRYACYLIAQNGDQALFGRSTQAMKAQWKVPDHRPLADFAPTIVRKAKDFATEITIFNARQHAMHSESAISREHITNNEAVRRTLIERGIRPESLPPAEDVKKVERRLASEDKKSLQHPDGLGNDANA